MNAQPPRLFTRLAWLLAGTVALVVVIGALALRATSSQLAGDYAARTLALQIAAADALLAEGREGSLGALGIERAAVPPNGRAPVMRVLRGVLEDTRARAPDREMRLLVRERVPVLWIAAKPPAAGWIGIPLVGLRASLARTALFTAAVGTLVVLLMASAYARSLTAPLRRLAAAAGDVVAGTPPPPLAKPSVREIVDLELALVRAAANVRRGARERDLMLAALSHDLRTPLARLQLGLELADAPSDPHLRDGMVADIEAIDALSAQFIAFVRDGSEETSEDVDLAALVRELVTRNAIEGGAWRIDAPTTLWVRGKPLALARAVDNLIRNAIRHGAPPFRIQLEQRAGEARCAVADAGAGVPPALLERLGEAFFRADAARSGAQGSGLGLASSRRIARQHGGKLTLRNLPGGGFEAALSLPAPSDRDT